MTNIKDLAAADQAVLWHPCSQMKDYETFQPIQVVAAQGVNLILEDGSKVIDAISSWWCKNLGHGHPRLKAALFKQAEKFEHVLLANTTNELIVQLSEQLTRSTSNLTKICYASDGACAVEIALKLVTHGRLNKGQPEKTQIASLTNAYHGETLFALAVSDLGLYCAPYEKVMPKVHFIENVPYVASKEDPLWQCCTEYWAMIESHLNNLRNTLNAIIIEPIVQGAGGMLIYSQDFLTRLSKWCRANDVYLIADEIMTGFGRTGQFYAYQHADITPDIVCLGKGLTSGFLPMSAVMMTEEIYQLFYCDYKSGKSFLHSHTHTGNALAAAVALENLQVIAEEGILDQVQELEPALFENMMMVKEKTNRLQNIRYIGGVVAADIITPCKKDRAGYAVYQAAVKAGAFLRPLGNTLYWFPPLNIKVNEVKKLRDITIKAMIDAL